MPRRFLPAAHSVLTHGCSCGIVQHDGAGRRHRTVAVIWRETEGWQQADFERDKEFVAAQKLTEAADDVFVNGDSFIPGARALEPVFKARMFAPVEA